MAWAVATVFYHRGHRPERARRDGPQAFHSLMLMDDAALVEPLLGLRPRQSARVYEEGATQILGKGAINEEKKE